MDNNQAITRLHQPANELQAIEAGEAASVLFQNNDQHLGYTRRIRNQNDNHARREKLQNFGHLVSGVFKLATHKLSGCLSVKDKTVGQYIDYKEKEIILTLRNESNLLKLRNYSDQDIEITMNFRAHYLLSDFKKEFLELLYTKNRVPYGSVLERN